MAEVESIVGFRLSPQQERLWRLAEEGGLSPYRSRCTVLVSAALDAAGLRAALDRVAERHEILRSSFQVVPGMALPLQVVGDRCHLDLAQFDVPGEDQQDLERLALASFDEMERLPFDPAEGPTLRMRLFSQGPTRHALVVAASALHLDALGLRNLLLELGRSLAALPAEPADALQYADLAEWQHELLAESGAGADFWDAPGGVSPQAGSLPWERPAATADYAPASIPFHLEPGLTAGAAAAATQHDVDLSDLLLTVWQVLLCRLTGCPEIRIGVDCEGRSYDGLDEQLGLFARRLPVDLRWEPEAGLSQALRRTRRAVAQARDWQEYFDWSRWAGDDGGNLPFLPFAFDLLEAWTSQVPSFPWRLLRAGAEIDRSAIRLSCLRSGEVLHAEVRYDARRIGEREAGFLVERFQCLLRSALRDPEAKLGDLDLVGPAERQWLLGELNRTARAHPAAGRCLHELVMEQALRTPERTAVVAVEGAMTYAELLVRSQDLARRLRYLGVGPEVCVGVWVERSLDLPVALLGVLAAGGAYVPLDPTYPRERLRTVIVAAGAALLVAPAGRAADLAADGVRVVPIEAGPEEEGSDPLAGGAAPDHLAYVLFTSGSTGRPKGVMVSQAAIVNRLLWMQSALPLGAGDVVLQKTAASFDASIWELFVPLLSGARLAMAPPEAHRDSVRLVELVERFGVTTLQLVPSQWRLVLDEPGFARCRSLRRVFSGGEALPAGLRERIAGRLGIELVNLYGPTECAIDATWFPCSVADESDALAGAVVPIGRPIDNVHTYVLDRLQRPVAAGLAGELCVAGAGLARGYRDRPDATAEAFVPDPWSGVPGGRMYRTGDLARYLPGGALGFLGRIDHQVKVRGFRIELGEIESLLASHPGVAEAAVVTRAIGTGDLQLVAYVVGRQVADLTTADLRGFLAGRLPDFMIPGVLLIVPALPRLPSGKIDRRGLTAAELASAGPEEGEEMGVAPSRSPVEEILEGIFAIALQRDLIAPTDSFFDLGGHSLLATQVVARVRTSLGVEMPMRTLFDHPTPRCLAGEIEVLLARGKARELPPITPVDRRGDLPLSYAQERLWLVQQLAPGNVAYNLPFLVDVPRTIDLALLAQALCQVAERHEALRTTFPVRDGRPVQRVCPLAPDGLPVVDLQALPPLRAQDEVESLATAEARRPFDLARGPLFRATALLGREQAHVIFNLHHAASDAWSVGILLGELEALYAALLRAAPYPLVDLPVQYGDYAVWQRAWLESDLAVAQLAFWREQLAGAPWLLDLPLDRPRPAAPSARGANRTTLVPAVVVSGLKALARRQGVTLFMTLLAAWKVLLHRLSGQRDLVVGTPTASRTRAEIEGLIGVFINVLPLRTDLAGSLPVVELLTRIKSATLGAFSAQDLPFERLVQEVEPERSSRHTPLVQVMFALQNAPVGRLRLAGETLAVRPLTTGEVQLDLILSVTETAAGMLCQLGYRSELFDTATMMRLQERLHALLAALAAGEAERCEDLAPLPESERHQVLYEWGIAAEASGGGPWASELFAARAALQPQATAVICGAERLTYGELAQLARRIAWRLRREGVGPEVPVGVLMERSPALVAALLGTWIAGGVYVPLEPGLPEARLRLMLEEGGVDLVLTEPALAGGLPTTARALLLSSWEDSAAKERVPAVPLTGQSLAYLIFTSGTTGRPKAVMVTHGNLAQTLAAGRERFAFGPEDAMLHLASFGFDISLFELLLPLTTGGCAVVLQRDEILDLPRLAAALLGATRFHAVPSLMRQLVRHLRARGEPPHRLRTVFTGGDAVPAELLREMREVFPESDTVVLYGPTEGTIICSAWSVPARGEIAPAVIGRPLPGALLRIVDASGASAPIGVAGELWLAGGGVTRGYLGRPDLTADKYRPGDDADPRGNGGARNYRTGDRARLLADGSIEFLGRIDNQVKVRGYRVEPSDVEAALAEHSGVAEIAVVPRSAAERDGELQLVAYVVARDQHLTAADLQRLARERLPAYMVPGAFVLLAALPRNASGKLDRVSLPEPDPARSGADQAYAPPRSSREEVLAEIWAQTLGLPRVGVHDNFFTLGGDSILCIQIVARANQQGFRLTPRDLFDHQTVAELAAVSPAGGVPGLLPEQGTVMGEVPLVPVQHRFFAETPVEPHHFNQAVLLAVWQAPAPSHLATAVEHLVLHHDALRLRFERRGGMWRQIHAAPAAGEAFTCIDLAALPPERLGGAIGSAAEPIQTSLDLARGPLLRAVLFLTPPGEPARLLLVVHHLVVDGVSWRILLADLERAFQQLAGGEAVKLPEKTTSFKEWAEQLVIAARSPGVRAELEGWLAPHRARLLPLPVDLRGANSVDSEETVTVSLDAVETRQLLREAVQPYRTRVDHLLLAAVAHAFAAWTRGPALLVDMESHGREEIVPGLDLSSTVGWFTSIYPVLLEVPPSGGWSALVKMTKEQVQRVPKQGIGYGLLRYLCTDEEAAALGRQRQAEVSFNYLGQLDRILAPDSPFLPAREPAGPTRSPRQARSHLIDVTASVAGERLQIAWTYGTAVYRRETIEKLAAGFLDALRSLLEHCLSPEAGGYTPSDFPLARLDQAALDLLVPPGEEIEDIYPQAPLQQGLFFHALLSPHGGDYIVQRRCALAGDLDVPALRRSWELLMARHPVLRTSFASAGLKVPVQRVHRRAGLPWIEEDWRHLTEAEQRERLAGFLDADRRRGFDPGQAPLFRVALFRLAESTFDFVWCAHHLLLDGWSMSLLFAELFAVYGDLRAGREPQMAPALPYRDYIEWIERQDRSECEAYWRRTLAGLARPTLLATGGGAATAGEEGGQGMASLELPEAATAELNAFAQRHQLTLGTLVQGALALLIGFHARSEDVVFGLTLAGRPAELGQMERRIGLFSNTLLMRVRVEPGEQVLPWLRRLQDNRLDGSRYEYSPLVDVQTWSGLPSGSPLFDTIFSYQNFPLDGSIDERSLGVRILRAEERAQNSNPLTVLAVPGRRFALTLLYDRRSASAARVEVLLQQLSLLLHGLAAHSCDPLAAVQALLQEHARGHEASQAQAFNEAMRGRLRRKERPAPRA